MFFFDIQMFERMRVHFIEVMKRMTPAVMLCYGQEMENTRVLESFTQNMN